VTSYLRNMMHAAYAGSILSLLFLFVGDARAQGQDPTVVTKLRILQQDAPVQILSMKLPDRSERQAGRHEPSVHLRNTSSSQTSRIWVETIITDPQGHVVSTSSDSPNELRPAERVILPGGEGWARETVLRSDNFLMAAKRLRSNCISVDVLVMRVDFADGTSWHLNRSKTLAASKPPEKIDETVACSSATASEDEIGRLTSVQFRPDQELPRPQDSSEVQSYSFLCSLHSDEGHIVGSCPF
jgi:hypothetical protein